MKVLVFHFAQVREACGISQETIDGLPGDAPVGAVWETLAARHPALAPLRPLVLPAVNARYAPWESEVRDGDEVSFIAPTGGG